MGENKNVNKENNTGVVFNIRIKKERNSGAFYKNVRVRVFSFFLIPAIENFSTGNFKYVMLN